MAKKIKKQANAVTEVKKALDENNITESALRDIEGYDKIYAEGYAIACTKGYVGNLAEEYATGFAKGKMSVQLSFAKNMLKLCVDEEIIAQVCNLNIDTIRRLA